jgi:phage terminase large subunit GpA-like protein
MSEQFGGLDALMRKVFTAFKPPENLTVSGWADRYRFLSAESSASPGRFRTEIVEYMREPMDMVGAPGVRVISLMTSAQVAKSTVLENVIGYFMHQDPCPILHVSPTLDSMKMFSKERLAPMIRDCPVLVDIVKDPRSRDSGNTLASKVFPGGHIAMVGSNAPAGLASRPIRVLVADEVDRFEHSAGTEGDPINLAIKRTTTFWNRVLLFVSTPGDKGRSRIEALFEEGDQRYRYCPCPDCGEHQRLVWAQVKWPSNDPSGAYYECEHCGSFWDDVRRNTAVRKGEWRASKPFNGNLSYHLSQLYSPFAPLADGVRDFLSAKSNPQFLKTWVNTFLGETWE